MEDERPAHPEGAAEETGFEDDVVPGDAWPDPAGSAGALAVVQSSQANTKAAKSTSWVSSRSRSSVVVPGLNEIVQGSTCATSSRPRVEAARQGLKQLRLLSGGAEEDAWLVHPCPSL
jgi:hypothetical protein